MKKITFILFALIAGTTFAQDASGTATATAKMVTPISITDGSVLNFGAIAANGIEDATVIVAPNSDGNAVSTSTATLVSSNTSAAEFTVNAANEHAYAISLPENVTLKSGDNNMIVSDLTPSITAPVGSGSNQTLYVGGTLKVGATQQSGSYSGEVKVTVSYN